MEPLTQKQKRVLDAIHSYYQSHGYPPTIRDLASKLSIVSLNCIRIHLRTLEKKGHLSIDPRSSRGIRLPNTQRFTPFYDVIELPIAGRIIAGPPQEAIQEIEDRIPIPRTLVGNAEDAFLLRVHGNSMEPELHEDDFVIVSPQKTAQSGEMVVALVDGEATVKLFYPHPDRIVLQAINPNYSPLEISKELSICGKVIGMLRKY